MSTHRVIVHGTEAGTANGPGRPVNVDGQDIGVAVDLDDLLLLLEEHDVYDLDTVEWRGGGPDEWGSA
ncbi:hypothetical protein [Streptacidiphilus jiangxiensis]|uniref:Uncharacterized protein n=1 Tax=Streptacidiphilus jiangxiensis TaxID=235985 RepID=A0A1H7WE48_STRJI|nr:hypothetical protein [Streptacidiphilus jiangxiensis]SEM19740.1 hypothetical protein SAMN05414137_120100 [Streptacidiphilus jiangxiensis]